MKDQSFLFLARHSGFSLIAEILTATRFTIIGAGATAIHMITVIFIINSFNGSPYFSNLIAFLIAFGASFIGHYYFSFRSQRDRFTALIRFFLVALAAFLINNIALSLVLRINYLPHDWATMLAATSIPAMTFFLSRLWVFS